MRMAEGNIYLTVRGDARRETRKEGHVPVGDLGGDTILLLPGMAFTTANITNDHQHVGTETHFGMVW